VRTESCGDTARGRRDEVFEQTVNAHKRAWRELFREAAQTDAAEINPAPPSQPIVHRTVGAANASETHPERRYVHTKRFHLQPTDGSIPASASRSVHG